MVFRGLYRCTRKCYLGISIHAVGFAIDWSGEVHREFADLCKRITTRKDTLVQRNVVSFTSRHRGICENPTVSCQEWIRSKISGVGAVRTIVYRPTDAAPSTTAVSDKEAGDQSGA
jgi:hypothetical protein